VIRVCSAPEALADIAAELFVEEARTAVSDRGRFAVALAGGDTPRPAYRRLREPRLRGRVDWEAVHLFWGDERCVPPDDERSNYRMVQEALLEALQLPERQIHPIRCAGDSKRAALDYEEQLRVFFGEEGPRFDLVLLGLGEDGHTASLFPGTPAATERTRWVAGVSDPGQPFARVSLTLPAINCARTVAFLVSGRRKAAAVQRVLEASGEGAPLPAQGVRPREGRVLWLVDAEAAALLDRVEWAGGDHP
jgi:6-phosphogluconolactonase